METVLIHQSLLFVNLQLKGYFFSELKRNYQELLLKHHPDKNGGKESETFLAVDKGYCQQNSETISIKYSSYMDF